MTPAPTSLQRAAEQLLASGALPDALVRAAIRFNCRTRLAAETGGYFDLRAGPEGNLDPAGLVPAAWAMPPGAGTIATRAASTQTTRSWPSARRAIE